jgi:hypothetical protein
MPTPTLATILRRIDRAAAAADGALRRTADADFVAGLCQVGTLRYDARSGGGVRDGAPDWQPVSGFEEVACLVRKKRSGTSEGANRPGEATQARALFAHELPAHRGYQLLMRDPLYGERAYYFHDKVVEEFDDAGVPHHWGADVQDRPL